MIAATAGDLVLGSMRDATRAVEGGSALAGKGQSNRPKFIELDLTSDSGWHAAL
ncbi:MAG: hypothetical protein AAF636_05045 [Pseudomonadota bacterium]